MKKTFEQTVREVADSDVEGLIEARRLYGDSWRAEGGVSAYFNIKRKIDRFVNCLKRPLEVAPGREPRVQYDVFSHVKADLEVGGETVLDTIRDLRRYLNLAEAFLLEQGVELPLQRDNLAAAKALPQTAAQPVMPSPPSPPLYFPPGVRGAITPARPSWPPPMNAPAEPPPVSMVSGEATDLGYAHASTEIGPRGFDPALDVADGATHGPDGTRMDREWAKS